MSVGTNQDVQTAPFDSYMDGLIKGWWISAPIWSLQLKNPEFPYENHEGWCNVMSNNTSIKTELTDLR